jgi:hypothetical protein
MKAKKKIDFDCQNFEQLAFKAMHEGKSLEQACHQAYSPVHLTFICGGYNLLQIIQYIFMCAFVHRQGDLCVINTISSSIFLFSKFQGTISGFSSEKCVCVPFQNYLNR